ncbi:MAG: hypothetical protein ACE1ZW_02990, partial [Nitrospirales bacterium]
MDPRIAAFFLLPSRAIGLFLSKNNFTAIYKDKKSRELGKGILNRLFGRAEKYQKNNHVFSLSIFYVAACYSLQLNSQFFLKEPPKASHSVSPFTCLTPVPLARLPPSMPRTLFERKNLVLN